jgi:hypothetical protein
MAYWGLLKRKESLVLTWRGRLFLLVVGITALFYAVQHIHSFLAPIRPSHGEILVVEGWVPDSVLNEAITLFNAGNYQLIVTTGGPITTGSYLSEHSTYANLAAATLRKLGVKQNVVVPVPAPFAQKNRTFASALALKDWLSQRRMLSPALDVLSLGAHARRTQLLFQKALGDNVQVGIIAASNPQYDANKWWTSSAGVRTLIGETLAYLYARFLFNPQEQGGAYPNDV